MGVDTGRVGGWCGGGAGWGTRGDHHVRIEWGEGGSRGRLHIGSIKNKQSPEMEGVTHVL